MQTYSPRISECVPHAGPWRGGSEQERQIPATSDLPPVRERDRGNINEYPQERQRGARGQRATSDWVLREHLLSKVMWSRAQKEGRKPGWSTGKCFWGGRSSKCRGAVVTTPHVFVFEKSWELSGQGGRHAR